jgi:hypothetical protein
MGEAIVESSPELSVGKSLGQVFLGQKPCAHGQTDGGGQPRLILWDRSLEEGEGSAEDARRLIGMEEHPDGHGIGETPCKGPEHHGEKRLEKLFWHGQRCR